jgi:hypothetical protein
VTLSRQNLAVLTVSATAFGVGFAWVWNSTPKITAVRAVPRPSSSASPPSAFRPSGPSAFAGAPVSAGAAWGPGGATNPEAIGNVKQSASAPSIRFGPIEGALLFGVSDLNTRLIDGNIQITHREWRKASAKGKTAGRSAKQVTNVPIWRGPVGEARFIHEVNDAVHTLKDRKGRILWSNAAENGSPDLVIDTEVNGETHLLDKKRTVLWSGTLPAGRHYVLRSGPITGRTYRIDMGGVFITGTPGRCTVTDNLNRELWSGRLPEHPVILFRRGPEFNFMAPGRATMGTDHVAEVRLEVEPGQVVTASADGTILAAGMIDLLKISQTNEVAPRAYLPGSMTFPPRFLAPAPLPGQRKDFRFTYRDRFGRPIPRDGEKPASLVAAPPRGTPQPQG